MQSPYASVIPIANTMVTAGGLDMFEAERCSSTEFTTIYPFYQQFIALFNIKAKPETLMLDCEWSNSFTGRSGTLQDGCFILISAEQLMIFGVIHLYPRQGRGYLLRLGLSLTSCLFVTCKIHKTNLTSKIIGG